MALRGAGSLSALINDLIHEEHSRPDDPTAELNIHRNGIIRALNSATIAFEEPKRTNGPLIDFILPKIGTGIEIKTRFSPGASSQKMTEIIGYSAGKLTVPRRTYASS